MNRVSTLPHGPKSDTASEGEGTGTTPVALDVVMNGKKLAAVPALKAGLVDEIMPREHLLRFALDYVTRGKPHRKSHALTNNPLAASFIGFPADATTGMAASLVSQVKRIVFDAKTQSGYMRLKCVVA